MIYKPYKKLRGDIRGYKRDTGHPGAVEPENLVMGNGFIVGSSQMRETIVLRFDRHWAAMKTIWRER